MSSTMSLSLTPRVGVMLPRNLPAAEIIPFARKAEALGFAEIWIVEDCFFRGGIAQAAVVLASTESIAVGIGILPATARNAAFTALEVATLAELYPGRTTIGIGHGVTEWMRQIGAKPVSALTMLDEHLTTIRSLLRGEEVTKNGRYVQLDAVKLENALPVVPPVLAGVRGPKSLAISGRSADGTILAEPVTPEYITAAKQQIGTARDHQIVAYNVAVVDDDVESARNTARTALEWIGDPDLDPHISPLPFADAFTEHRERAKSGQEFAATLPGEWVDALALVGPPDRVRARITELHSAGAHSVVLIPVGPDPLSALDAFARVLEIVIDDRDAQ